MGGWLKSCVSKFWVAQNCARKFRVTILLRDPLTIPDYIITLPLLLLAQNGVVTSTLDSHTSSLDIVQI